MTSYRRYYLWCPEWNPGAPPPIQDQIISYSNHEIDTTRAWSPAMCPFVDESGHPFPQGQDRLSTNDEARRIRDMYRCTNHDIRPEVFRQHAAYNRRRNERINQVSQIVSFRQRPDLIPDNYTINEHRRWLIITIPRRPDPVTTHTTWATT